MRGNTHVHRLGGTLHLDWIAATLHVAAFRVQRVLHIWRYNNVDAEKGEGGVVAEWRRREGPVAGRLELVVAQMTTPSLFSLCSLSVVCPSVSLLFPFSVVPCVSMRFPRFVPWSQCPFDASVSVSVVRAVRAVLSRAVCCAVFLCAVRCVLCRLRVMCLMRCDAALLTLMFCCSLLPVTENPLFDNDVPFLST